MALSVHPSLSDRIKEFLRISTIRDKVNLLHNTDVLISPSVGMYVRVTVRIIAYGTDHKSSEIIEIPKGALSESRFEKDILNFITTAHQNLLNKLFSFI